MSDTDEQTLVEYCAHNTDGAAAEALPVATRKYPCLERCGRCRRTPFLVVDGTVIEGASHAELAERLEGSR